MEIMDARVEKVVAIMREEFHRNLSLNELARSVNLSLWHLSHLFKSEMGLSPALYLKNYRMQQAAVLLESTFLSVKEITARVGFRDESHFVRVFKGAYGLTPVRYRASASKQSSRVDGTGS
jgi:two-component system, response regulator YesN